MIDLSEKAIQKKVNSELMQRPLGLLSFSAGLVLFLSGSLFSTGLLYKIGGASFILGAGIYLLAFLRRSALEVRVRYKLLDHFQKEELNSKIEQRHNLKETLARISKSGDNRLIRFSDQATKQLDIAEEDFKKLEELLHKKLNPREQTFIRLFGMSQQLYFCILDNLERSTMLLDSAVQVDEQYIEHRLGDIEKKEKTEIDEREIRTLNERMTEKLQQVKTVDELLTSNEEALTKIIKTMTQIAEAHIEKGTRASVGMKFASESLDNLISIVKNF